MAVAAFWLSLPYKATTQKLITTQFEKGDDRQESKIESDDWWKTFKHMFIMFVLTWCLFVN